MIYLDFDGVLVDFNRGCVDILGHDLDDKIVQDMPYYERGKFLEKNLDTIDFWANLKPMEDFSILWAYVKGYKPCTLTAYPNWGKDSIAKQGKWQWAKKHLQIPESRFNCVSREAKQKFAMVGGTINILIDDHEKNIQEWSMKGGIGILHKNARQTIEQLQVAGY